MTLRDWHAESGGTADRFHVLCILPFFLATAGAMAVERHASLPLPADLSMDGRQAVIRSKPVVILFSLPDCPYCDVVRQNYLVPLVRDVPERQRPIIREVRITGATRFSDFNRKSVSQRELAAGYGVRFAPTVIVVDGAGNLLAPPVIGGDVAGLYGGYLDNALAGASEKMAAARKTKTRNRTQ